MTTRGYVALGANLSDPVSVVGRAITALRGLPHCRVIAASSLYRTAPVGLLRQPDFINAVVAMDIDDAVLSPLTLLQALLAVEADFGRVRTVPNAARTLDLDLLLYGETVLDGPDCVVPHPRMHQRAFVLAPLAEIAPALVIPRRGSVADFLAACRTQRIDRLTPLPLAG